MVIFYKKWKKYNEIQLTKNKMDLNNRKITKSSTLPRICELQFKPVCDLGRWFILYNNTTKPLSLAGWEYRNLELHIGLFR